MVPWTGAGPHRRPIVDPFAAFVLDPSPGPHVSGPGLPGLDLDVTLGPPVGPVAWPPATPTTPTTRDDPGDEWPIGSVAAYRPT